LHFEKIRFFNLVPRPLFNFRPYLVEVFNQVLIWIPILRTFQFHPLHVQLDPWSLIFSSIKLSIGINGLPNFTILSLLVLQLLICAILTNLVHFQPFPMQDFQIFNPNNIQTSYGLNACLFVIQNIF
jgi:hypothetical protein